MDQPIYMARRFAATWRSLDPKLREKAINVILALRELLARPHQHTGFGFRRLHGSDYWEARLDLRWRLVLRVGPKDVVLFDVMNHDQVRRL